MTITRDDVVRAYRARMTPDYLASITLRSGTGSGEPDDACLIQRERWELRSIARELGAYDLANEYDPSTDACPPCTSPICHRIGISIQDAREDWRAECVSILPLLAGSHGSDALRTFAEAYRKGMIEGTSMTARESRTNDEWGNYRPGANVIRESHRPEEHLKFRGRSVNVRR
mgnify:CR=1 FL=1